MCGIPKQFSLEMVSRRRGRFRKPRPNLFGYMEQSPGTIGYYLRFQLQNGTSILECPTYCRHLAT